MSKSWTDSIWCLADGQQAVNEWENNMLSVMSIKKFGDNVEFSESCHMYFTHSGLVWFA